MLDELEKQRYKRHFLLPGWDESEQEKLKNTTVFVAGAGGTGSPTITMLALLGVGTIKICDFDVFEVSNQNRQFLHAFSEDRLGMNKAKSAAKTVKMLNPNVEVVYYDEKFTEENIDMMVGNSDFIFDCVDKFKYKFILADCAQRLNIPMFFYGIMNYNTFGYIFHPPKTACFHCIFDESKVEYIERANLRAGDVAATSTALFTAAGIMASQALKYLVNKEEIPFNKMLLHFNKQKNAFNDKGVRAFRYWHTDYFYKESLKQGFDWNCNGDTDLFHTLYIEHNPDCPYCSKLHKNK